MTREEENGFTYKNVYATHLIGPLLIRNPYFMQYYIKRLLNKEDIKELIAYIKG